MMVLATDRTKEKENCQNFQRLRKFNNDNTKYYLYRLTLYN